MEQAQAVDLKREEAIFLRGMLTQILQTMANESKGHLMLLKRSGASALGAEHVILFQGKEIGNVESYYFEALSNTPTTSLRLFIRRVLGKIRLAGSEDLARSGLDLARKLGYRYITVVHHYALWDMTCDGEYLHLKE